MSSEASSTPVKSVAGPIAVGLLVFVLMLILGALGGMWWLQVSAKKELVPELRDRGQLAVLGDESLAGTDAYGTVTVNVRRLPEVYAALKGSDEKALQAVMKRHRIQGILAGPLKYSATHPNQSLSHKIINYAALDLFRAELLSERAALYVPYHPPPITPVMGKALARLARQLLQGSKPPALESFPAELLQPSNVEVMVLIRNRIEPQLWRSARSSSVARALLTAVQVAKERWAEREQAMGGALDSMLNDLTIEVWLLSKDGTLADRSDVFINHVFKPDHGVAYEHKSAWRYMLPEAVKKNAQGSAVQAYKQLFLAGGEAESSTQRRDIHLYRLRAVLLGISEPEVEE